MVVDTAAPGVVVAADRAVVVNIVVSREVVALDTEAVDDGTGLLMLLLTTGSDAELDSGPCTPLSSRYDNWPLGDATLLNLSESGACDDAAGRLSDAVVVVGPVTGTVSDVFLAVWGTGSPGPDAIFPADTRDDPVGLGLIFSECDLMDKVGLVTGESCVVACSVLSMGDLAVVSTCPVLGLVDSAVDGLLDGGLVVWTGCCRAARRAWFLALICSRVLVCETGAGCRAATPPS